MFPANYYDPARVAPTQYTWLQKAAARFLRLPLDATVAQTNAPAEPEPANEPAVLSMLRQWDQAFAPENRARLSRYAQYEQFDKGDIASQLDAIVDAVLIGDDPREPQFKAVARGNRNINNLIQSTLERTGLQFKVRQILRDTLKYGDVATALWFEEAGGTLDIVGVQNLDAFYMLRRTDSYGRLFGGTEKHQIGGRTVDLPKAYWQVNPQTYAQAGAMTSTDPINGWLPWQMCWLRWRTSDKFRYSQGSYLSDMLDDAIKLRYMEASMVVARGTRAYPRRVFKSDLTSKSTEDRKKALTQFRQQMEETESYAQNGSGNVTSGARRRSPLEVDQDLYIGTGYVKGAEGKLYPALDSVELEDPRMEGIANVADIQYQRSHLFRRMSKGMMGEGDASQKDFTTQDQMFSKMCSYISNILRDELVYPILSLQGFLHGYDLTARDIDVVFPMSVVRNSWMGADSNFRASMARNNELSAGVSSLRSILRSEEHLTDPEIDVRMKEISDEMKLRASGALPPLGKQTDSGANGNSGDGANGPPNADKVRGGNNSA